MPSGSGGNTGGDSTKNTYHWAVEFMTDAPKVMLRYACTSGKYMVEVDDRPVSATVLSYPSTSGTGDTLLDFTSVGGAAVRKIRMEMNLAAIYDGAYVGPTYSVWKPADENDIRVCTVGDSIEDGTGTTFPNGAWSKAAGKLLGWTDVRQVAFSGAGFVAAGSFNTIGSALRVSDVVAHAPDLVLIVGSQNDDASVGSVAAAALAAFQAYRTALPNAPIVVMGADPGSSGPSATRLNVEAAVLSAFNTDSKSFHIPVSNAADGSWFTGTGYVGATTGTGNRDRYGFDAAHPNDSGHLYRARRFSAAFRSLVLPTVR
jgi:lysophospholipase L1-like esterase